MALLLLLFPSLSQASLGDKFAACHQYDDEINSAVKRWGGTYQYPLAWKAQLYQESHCKLSAISYAGAQGVAQIMPDTWADLETRYGIKASPFSKIAIEWGYRYQSQMRYIWRADRPAHERERLAQASYNAGAGSIIKAQKRCGNAPYWSTIQYCLPQITGDKNAHETTTYVKYTERWMHEMGEKTPWLIPPGLRANNTGAIISRIQEKYDVRRHFSGYAWGSYWRIWDGWITADHVHKEMLGAQPSFAKGSVWRHPHTIDATAYSIVLGNHVPAPRAPLIGEKVYILGYPAGSDKPSLRYGRIYYKRKTAGNTRYAHLDTIIVIEAPNTHMNGADYEPVIGGMSGGIVVSTDLTALGVLVAQNSPTDLTGNGTDDQSADFVPLLDIYREFSQ